MCGIAGIVQVDGTMPDTAVLRRMAAIIAHRGPDDEGIHVDVGIGLAHRRLSIIDLSPRGHQPMANDSGTLHIVYNGEVYNYIEIRDGLEKRGHHFCTDSDTEVILRAYEEYGEECLRHFNGMFAFAVWDSHRRCLFAARDRVGIKPFYYAIAGGTFVFASEIKALLRHPAVSSRPDEEAIRRYLLLGNTMSDSTWYDGIRTLPPGSSLTFEDGEMSVRKYWDIRYEPEYSRSFGSFRDELCSLLTDAVKLHLRSDLPVGAYLSGGIDSSSVVSLAAPQAASGFHTFSAAFEEGKDYDERRYIDVVSRQFGTVHHEVIPSAADLPGLLPRLIWHLDEPVIGAAILPMYRVCELVARSGVKVVNGGQGGDELFGGYPPYYVLAARNAVAALKNGKVSADLLREIPYLPSYLGKGGAFGRLLSRFRPRSPEVAWLRGGDDIRHQVGDIWQTALSSSPATNKFDEMAYLSLKYFLSGLLQQEDRMSMAWSIESRVPLLDYRIIEFSGRVPSWMKVRRGVLKALLREAMRDIVPDAILDRTDKKGYPTPTGRWFAGPLGPYLRENLCARELASAALVDPRSVATLVEQHATGSADHGAVLWTILNLEIWMRGVSNGWESVGVVEA